jgi:hypothetical protein
VSLGMKSVDLPYAFTRRQALAVGLSDFRLQRLVRRGELVRLRPGVFVSSAPPAPELRAEGHLALAVAALNTHRDRFALSHLSAAAAHGLPLPLGPLDTVHLLDVSPSAKSRRAPGLWVHSSDSYLVDLAATEGAPLTSAVRTVADCLRAFGPRVSVPIADAALHRGLVTRAALLAEMAMQCHWPGRTQADAAAPLVDGRRETWLESYAFVRLAEWGLTVPQAQVEVFDEYGDFVARTDGAWVEQATVLELDGKSKYRLVRNGSVDPQAAWEQEKARYDRVGNLGVERVRFGLTDLLRHGDRVRSSIRHRRACGSLARFTGHFRIPSASDLTLS